VRVGEALGSVDGQIFQSGHDSETPFLRSV